MATRKRERVRETFTVICKVDSLPGVSRNYKGFWCYIPDDTPQGYFTFGNRVRVTVERLGQRRKHDK